MSLSRKVRRNDLKEEIGSNKIKDKWRIEQVKHYGIAEYSRILKENNIIRKNVIKEK